MRRGPEFFPNLPVVNQNGEQLKFYDDLIKDKIVIVMFIYTSCTDICPLTTARMTLIEDKLGPLVGKDIFIVSMTVDPEVDTPEKLKAYSKAFATGPGWTFVTGKPEDIRAINYRLGERSKVLSEHRNEIVLGNDVTGEWQRDNVMGDLDRVVTDDPRDGPEMARAGAAGSAQSRDEHRPGDGHAARTGDVQEDLRALSHHRRRRQSGAGPARRHRAARPRLACRATCAIRRRCWRRTIRSRVALAAKFDPIRMPNMRLSEQDADDLISFLQQETAKLVEATGRARISITSTSIERAPARARCVSVAQPSAASPPSTRDARVQSVLVCRPPLLHEQEIVGVQVRQGHVVQRDRVGGIQGYHRVGADLLGVRHDRGEVGKQRCVELKDVADGGARGEVRDTIDAEPVAEHERVVASRAGEDIVARAALDGVCTSRCRAVCRQRSCR